MKLNNLYRIAFAIMISVTAFNCSNDDDNTPDPGPMGPDFSGTFVQQDQVARPAINTVFTSDGSKNTFNTTVPSQQGAAFQAAYESKLLALNPGYTTNLLGLDAPTFTTVLATDVLNVSLDGQTTFFDPNTGVALTGRALADDVIDVELILIFGGPDATENPGLTSDNVDGNDKEFLSSFPYLASPF